MWHHGFAWYTAASSDGWIKVCNGDSAIFCDSSARHKTKKVGVATHERFEEARAAALPRQEEFVLTAAGDTLVFGEWTLTAYADAASTAAASAAPAAKAVASVTVEAVHSSDPAHRFRMQRDTPELLQYLVNELKSTLTLDLTLDEPAAAVPAASAQTAVAAAATVGQTHHDHSPERTAGAAELLTPASRSTRACTPDEAGPSGADSVESVKATIRRMPVEEQKLVLAWLKASPPSPAGEVPSVSPPATAIPSSPQARSSSRELFSEVPAGPPPAENGAKSPAAKDDAPPAAVATSDRIFEPCVLLVGDAVRLSAPVRREVQRRGGVLISVSDALGACSARKPTHLVAGTHRLDAPLMDVLARLRAAHRWDFTGLQVVHFSWLQKCCDRNALRDTKHHLYLVQPPLDLALLERWTPLEPNEQAEAQPPVAELGLPPRFARPPAEAATLVAAVRAVQVSDPTAATLLVLPLVPDGWRLQLRCGALRVDPFSRAGKVEFRNAPLRLVLLAEVRMLGLPPRCVLDCELVPLKADGTPAGKAKGSCLFAGTEPQLGWRAHVHDLYDPAVPDAPYAQRMAGLDAALVRAAAVAAAAGVPLRFEAVPRLAELTAATPDAAILALGRNLLDLRGQGLILRGAEAPAVFRGLPPNDLLRAEPCVGVTVKPDSLTWPEPLLLMALGTQTRGTGLARRLLLGARDEAADAAAGDKVIYRFAGKAKVLDAGLLNRRPGDVAWVELPDADVVDEKVNQWFAEPFLVRVQADYRGMDDRPQLLFARAVALARAGEALMQHGAINDALMQQARDAFQ